MLRAGHSAARRAGLVGTVMLMSSLGGGGQGAEPLSRHDAYEIGLEGYTYFYPLVVMDITRAQMTNVPPGGSPRTRPLNVFLHQRAYPGAGSRTVVRPNFDTLYSIAWLDVREEPIIVSVPDTRGRYYLLPLMDMWTDVFAVIGSRTTGTGAGDFAVTEPDWRGALPEGVVRLISPTPQVWIIGRILTRGPADYPAVHALQDGFRLSPLSQWGRTSEAVAGHFDPSIDATTPAPKQVAAMAPAKFFAMATELLRLHPPHRVDQPILARMARLGIAPGRTFDFANADPVIAQAVSEAAAEGLQRIRSAPGLSSRRVNGWRIANDFIGAYGASYLRRAAVALFGLGAVLPEDAVYPSTSTDGDGRPLDGAGNYVLRFTSSEVPPADAFWSVTVYDNDGYPVANVLNRFALGDRDPINFAADGSLELYLSAQSPGGDREANWLPIPRAAFNLTMRLYAPQRAVLEGAWSPPPVLRTP